MAGPGVIVIVGGGDPAQLERELEHHAGAANAILSSGLAGALDPALKPGDIVIGMGCVGGDGRENGPPSRSPAKADQLDPSDWTPAFAGEQGRAAGETPPTLANRLAGILPKAHIGLVAASDHPAAGAGEKARLYRETDALAVDMESHVASRIAARHGLPFAALRIISDAADMTLPPAALVGMRPDGGVASGAILRSLARHPAQLPALIRLGRDAGTAFRVLGGVHDALRRSGIGGLDPGQFPLDMG